MEERKRIEQLRRERDEERQIQDLQQLQEDSGKSRQQNRVDWMYQAPSGAGGHVAEEMEGYLLGKRRIDGVLLRSEEKGGMGERGVDVFVKPGESGGGGAPPPAINTRDTMTKVIADPLLEVKKREQAAYEAAVKESARRGKKPVLNDGSGREREKEREGGRDRHARRRPYSDEEDSHRRYRHRSHRHRSRSRSKSPYLLERRRSHRNRRDERDFRDDCRDRERRDRDRREDRGRDRDRDRKDRDYRASSRQRERDDRYYDRSSRRDSYRRSPSPRPERGYRDHDRDNRRDSYSRRDRDRRLQPNSYGRDNDNNNHNHNANAKSLEEGRQRRLAEMQSNATDLEANRRQRIAHVNAVEDQQRENDDKNRSERGQFVSQLHLQLQEDSLDERIRRSRSGLAVERDD